MKDSNVPHIGQMHQAAVKTMERQGVSPAEIDPTVVMFAMQPEGDVQAAANEAIIAKIRPIELGEHSIDEVGNKAKEAALGEEVLAQASDIAKPARRRDVLLASLLGVVLSASFFAGTAKIKEDIRSEPGGLRPASNGDRIINGTALVGDGSIMPNDTAEDIPVVGPVLEKIPGIPDFGSTYLRIHTTASRTVTERRLVLSDFHSNTSVVNPVSPDLQPTGKEYGLGRRVAHNLFRKIMPNRFDVDSITVTGKVSDEFGGVLGEADPEQEQLALTRARITANAVEDEALARGIKIPSDIAIKGEEAVLTPTQIDTIDRAAERLKLSTPELLSLYNEGRVPSRRATKLLNHYLGNRRGGEIAIEGEQEKTKTFKVVKEVPINKDKLFSDEVPGEAFIGVGLFLGLLYGSVISTFRTYSRFISKRSKILAQEKGLDL